MGSLKIVCASKFKSDFLENRLREHLVVIPKPFDITDD